MQLHGSERSFATAVAKLAYANPFRREETGLEEAVLAIPLPQHIDVAATSVQPVSERPLITEVIRRAKALAESVLQRGGVLREADAELYGDLVRYVLYFRYREQFRGVLADAIESSRSTPLKGKTRVRCYSEFQRDVLHFLPSASVTSGPLSNPAHLFAGFYQIVRAFRLINANIIGRSPAAEKLRVAVWESIFTHNMRRYSVGLYDRMHDLTTLITGPSGTGKDLVAETIGLSRYIRFDAASEQFEDDAVVGFHPINLAAIPATLIESELFGYRKGAFTGAAQDRAGLFEECVRSHSVFLDEIGELSTSIQVKLLRVLQNREFQRVGDTQLRRFEGKVIAATNRDLGTEVREGRFRSDFYYRLCADMIRTPTLAEQICGSREELALLVGFIANRYFEPVAEQLTADVVGWITQNLGLDFSWPGNMRELEQCVRNVVVRGEYHPLKPDHASAQPNADVVALKLSATELLGWYCQRVYDETGSYLATAERLGLDRRTVKLRVEEWNARQHE